MADNYLEKRMEDYRRSQSAAGSRRPMSRPGLRPGEVVIKYPSVRVIVTDGCSSTGRAIIETLRALNCRVAFTDPDGTAGRQLAQTSGSQFHPNADALTVGVRLSDAGDPAAATINPTDGVILIANGTQIAFPAQCHQPAEIAVFCAYALHPLAAWLRP